MFGIGIESQILTKFQFYRIANVLSFPFPKLEIQSPNIAKTNGFNFSMIDATRGFNNITESKIKI